MTGLALVAGFGLSAATAPAAQKPSPPTSRGASTSSAALADDEAASALRQYHRHHHRGGVTSFVAMSLDTLGTDEAKTPQVDKLHSDLHAQMAPAREAEKSLLLTLTDGIAAGTIDKVKVDAAIATLTTAADTEHVASVETLNQLHAILSPAERAALVDKVQAHWEVWRQANHEEAAGRRERGGRLANLTEQLSLAPDQVNKISAALQTARTGRPVEFDPKKGEADVEAFSKAFASDSFDAKSLTLKANADLASYGATRMALFYETVTPLLTPEQRTKLAEHLREHASYQSATSGK
jgi:Spy/CpxP family protein refolding chaperone